MDVQETYNFHRCFVCVCVHACACARERERDMREQNGSNTETSVSSFAAITDVSLVLGTVKCCRK